MNGKIIKIIPSSNFGFIKSSTNEEFYFALQDFVNIKNINEINISDSVNFEATISVRGKNRNAVKIFKENKKRIELNRQTNKQKIVQDILNKYPIKLNNIMEISKKLAIDKIWNESSFISDFNMERIVKEFYSNNTLTRQSKQSTYNNSLIKENNPRYNNIPTKQNSFNNKSINNSIMEEYIKQGYLVFIDTCSLMNYNMLKILKNEVIPYLKKFDRKVYIVDSVIYEIENKLKHFNDAETIKKAKAAQYVLSVLAKDDLYEIPDTNSINKKFADSELISFFTDYRTKYNLCLITNDNKHKEEGKLAGSITKLNNDPSIRKKYDIKVLCINHSKDNPKLIEFAFNKDSNFRLHDNAPKRVKL